jgi:2-polyprenyl-3-methyl-5-hydroxy-6-metoxy-1,4-benzoquinol methylase
VNPAAIFECFAAYQKTAAIQAAVDIELFTAIAAGNTTVDQAAKACTASPKGVRILCDYWTVNGLLAKRDGRYSLTPEAAMFLDRRSPAYVGDVVGFINGPITPFFANLTDSVRRGGRGDEGSVEPEFEGWITFAERMGAMMMPAADAIAGLIGPVSGKALDIAAGHGFFGIVLAQKNPGLKVTALDWPKVLEVARRHATTMGVGDRYDTIAGDAFKSDLEGPYDVALLTNLLHHFDIEECTALLRRLRSALKPGGKLATLEFIPNEDRISPPMSATFPLVMLATTAAGDAYTFSELERMLRSAGFRRNTLHQLDQSPQQVVISE